MKTPKLFFLISVILISFLYGYASSTWSLPPDSIIKKAWVQAEASLISKSWFRSPHFLHSNPYDRTGARLSDSVSARPRLTLITSMWRKDGDWSPGVKLIDQEGKTVHKWFPAEESYPTDIGSQRQEIYIHGTHLFPDGDLLVNYEYGGTARLDACARTEWQKSWGSHHSIERDFAGTFWVPRTSQQPRAASEQYPEGYPGLDNSVWIDYALKITGEGDLLRKMNVLDLIYENDLERYIIKGDIFRDDITHLNDIEPLPDSLADEYPLFEEGDLLMSLRNLHLVLVVDPKSKNVKWHASAPFIQQHDPDYVGEGWIGVFDNRKDGTSRGEMLGGSRIVYVRPHTDSTVVHYPTKLSDPFYTPAGGKWQKLENGNMLLTEAQAGRVAEVAPDGSTVWEWIRKPATESKTVEILEATRYKYTREDISSWPCSTLESTSAFNRDKGP